MCPGDRHKCRRFVLSAGRDGVAGTGSADAANPTTCGALPPALCRGSILHHYHSGIGACSHLCLLPSRGCAQVLTPRCGLLRCTHRRCAQSAVGKGGAEAAKLTDARQLHAWVASEQVHRALGNMLRHAILLIASNCRSLRRHPSPHSECIALVHASAAWFPAGLCTFLVTELPHAAPGRQPAPLKPHTAHSHPTMAAHSPSWPALGRCGRPAPSKQSRSGPGPACTGQCTAPR